jgi:hypothetical protein
MLPNWRAVVAKGQDATNAYYRAGGFIVPCKWSGFIVSPRDFVEWQYGQYFIATGPSFDFATLNDQALTRLKRNLNGHIGQAQLAAPLAESREIHRLVRDINRQGEEIMLALLRLKRTHGKSAVKHAAKLWLGFGFAVNPLLKDIESLATSILDYQTRMDQRIKIHSIASTDFKTASNGGVDMSEYGTLVTVTDEVHRCSVRYAAGINLTIRSDASYSVSDHLGLQVSDLPSALWELTPYSWAVDYFTTVGPWLDDMFYTLPGITTYLYRTEKHTIEGRISGYCLLSNKSYVNGTVVKDGKYEWYSFRRVPLTTLPSRQLRVKTVDEIASYGIKKVLNLASVLAGRINIFA